MHDLAKNKSCYASECKKNVTRNLTKTMSDFSGSPRAPGSVFVRACSRWMPSDL